MRKLNPLLPMFLALSVIFTGVVACASTAKTEGTGEYIDDTVITAKVKEKLLIEKELKSLEINVETFKGRVQLSGFVSSKENAKRALDIARAVPGVNSVINNMQIK